MALNSPRMMTFHSTGIVSGIFWRNFRRKILFDICCRLTINSIPTRRIDFSGDQFEMHLHESSKIENHILRMTASQAPLLDRSDAGESSRGTRDALGFLYYLRTVNWQRTMDVRSPVFDGRKVYDVHATLVTPRGDLAVTAGKFTATGLSIRPYVNGKELADTKITLWIAQDAAHTPILIELELPFGPGRSNLRRQRGEIIFVRSYSFAPGRDSLIEVAQFTRWKRDSPEIRRLG